MKINDYIEFISNNKTERECVDAAEKLLKNAGFRNVDKFFGIGSSSYGCGDKIYFKNKNKNIAAFVVGSDKKMNLLGAHIDSPRLDVKTMPLYESNGMSYLDLQYYGGIKKYQWTTRPLAIHGFVCGLDGKTHNVSIGDYNDNFTLCITDLLPHLDKGIVERKASDTIKGENLDLLIGTKKTPKSSKEKNPVKAAMLDILSKKYGISEELFLSSELEVVPAGKASYVGIDKTMVGGYGQDDRVCAWTSLMALIEVANKYSEVNPPERTIGCILIDKEEIGSTCATGSESRWLEDVLRNVTTPDDECEFGYILSNTNMLSSDVTAAYDPIYGDVSNASMSAKLGGGFVLSKYNGGRGKSGGADANPEFIAAVRSILNDSNVEYQFDTMGKVDVGGGGTIASIVCRLNINVMDAGVPVLNMHSPFEVTHVNDIENAVKGYVAFIDSDKLIYA